jgi:hypothetical protein
VTGVNAPDYICGLDPCYLRVQFFTSRIGKRGPQMRVTIEHREETSGVIRNRKDCYVDCKIEFSEEERAIIKAHDLYREGFSVRTSTPLPTHTAFWSTNIMRGIGPLMLIGGLFYGLFGEGLAGIKTNIAAPILFAGIGLSIWGWLRSRREDKRFDSSEQQVTISNFFQIPHSRCTPGILPPPKGWKTSYASILSP